MLLAFMYPIAYAQTMSNSQYKIKQGNLNTTGGLGTNSQYKLNQTLGETGAGLYSGTNYKVKAGFEYYKQSPIPFSFSISNNLIDFGVITPTNPVTRTTDLTISAPAGGFSVTASQDKPLTSPNGIIPDTSCDNSSCNTNKAGPWTSSLTYGFGYRCNLTDCSSDFLNPTFYKPFAASPSAQTVLTSTVAGSARKSRVTYKVNVPGTQSQGVYSNVVTYIAIPGF